MSTLVRVNYHLSAKQHAALKRIGKRSGLTVAELIRTAVAEWLKREKVNA